MLLVACLFGIGLTSGAQAADKVVVIPLSGKSMQNVVTVAKGGGRFTDPVAAMDSISDASATNPYLLLIGPGQYTLTSTLVMKEYVDVAGSGENVTLLTGAFSNSGATTASAIVSGAKHTTISNLSIKNIGGSKTYSLGVYNYYLDISTRMIQVNITATGGATSNMGVYNVHSPQLIMQNVSAIASGSPVNYGIYNNSSSIIITNSNVLVWGGTTNNYGIYNSGSTPVIEGCDVYAYNGDGGDYGVYNSSSDNVKIRRSTISGDTDGLYNLTSSNTIVSQSTIIHGVSGGGYTCPGSDDNLGHILTPATCVIAP